MAGAQPAGSASPDQPGACCLMTSLLEVSFEAATPEALLEGIRGAEIEGGSVGQIEWLRLGRDKVGMAGGVVIIVLILIAVLCPYLLQHPLIYPSNLINPTFSR